MLCLEVTELPHERVELCVGELGCVVDEVAIAVVPDELPELRDPRRRIGRHDVGIGSVIVSGGLVGGCVGATVGGAVGGVVEPLVSGVVEAVVDESVLVVVVGSTSSSSANTKTTNSTRAITITATMMPIAIRWAWDHLSPSGSPPPPPVGIAPRSPPHREPPFPGPVYTRVRSFGGRTGCVGSWLDTAFRSLRSAPARLVRCASACTSGSSGSCGRRFR